MRLLHVVNLRGQGGLEQLFTAYVTATRGRANPLPTIALKSDIHPSLRSALAGWTGTRYGIKHWRPLRLPALPSLRRWNIRRIVAESKADRVVFWSTLPGPEWRAACARTGADIIYYDHGNAWHAPENTARAALAGVERVLTVSNAGRRVIQQRFDYDGEVSVVPNGLRFESPALHRDYCADDRLRIGFAGRLVDVKGLPVLLAAAHALAEQGVEFEIHVAGTGPAETRMRRLVVDWRLTEHVTFHGAVADMRAFYRSVDVLVVPSLRESFGLASIEAASCGAVPVVAAVDGLPETLNHGVTGLALPPSQSMEAYRGLGGGIDGIPERVYDPEKDILTAPRIINPRDLADTLGHLANSPAGIEKMGRAAGHLARTRFSKDRFTRRLDENLYGS